MGSKKKSREITGKHLKGKAKSTVLMCHSAVGQMSKTSQKKRILNFIDALIYGTLSLRMSHWIWEALIP